MKQARLILIAASIFFFTLIPRQGSSMIFILKGESTLFTNSLFSSFIANTLEKVQIYNMQEMGEKIDFESIKSLKPSLIFTIGQTPVEQLSKNFPKLSIISVGHYDIMAFRNLPNVIPVSTDVPSSMAIQMLKELFTPKKRIGVIYNPKLTQFVTNELKTEMEKNGFEMAAIKIDTPEDIPLSIKAFKGNIDLFYFVTDATIFRAQSFDAILSFLIDNKIPYITPAGAFLKENGLMAMSVDPISMGRYIYRLSEKITADDKKKQDLFSTPPRLEIYFSLSASKKFGISAQKAQDFFRTALDKGYKVELVE